MGDFRGFIHGLVGATRRILCDTLCVSDCESIPRFRGTPLASGAHVDQRSVTGRAGCAGAIYYTLLATAAIYAQGGAVVQQVARFKEKLAVLVHVVSGQLARAPKLLSIQQVNTATNQQRNIFIEDGMVALVTAYYKGFYTSNDIKIGPDPSTRRTWSSERFQEVLKRQTKTCLKHAINIQSYRQIAITISRQFMQPASAFISNVQDKAKITQAVLDADAEEGQPSVTFGGRRLSSMDWHRFIAFPSAAEAPSALGKRKHSPWEEEADENRVLR
ncbi:uncharacterized protein ATNIH1004_009442 [Aspergillus tanneri]|uniref:Uncharacterized protein n=1 Tax=Aspergillus tanneri TaxID=1220188 RepID=A0A5M9MB79_9EURO|nr:uncharacterized protein ATNIH1004_009442 [Aspergillus tanneri]KAA8642690.1 hypothetical protein ATNIH1004_009442 [Aspergillus tanneri]